MLKKPRRNIPYRTLGSMLLDGVNDFVRNFTTFLGNDHFNRDVDEEASISGWYRPNDVGTQQCLTAKLDFLPGIDLKGWFVDMMADGTIRVAYQLDNANNQIRADSTTALENDKQYHICFTYDGSNDGSAGSMKIYINAVDDSSITSSNTPLASIKHLDEWSIGARRFNNPFFFLFFSGHVTEYTYWHIELTQADVLELFNDGNPTNPLLHSKSEFLEEWLPLHQPQYLIAAAKAGPFVLFGSYWQESFANTMGGDNGRYFALTSGMSSDNETNEYPAGPNI